MNSSSCQGACQVQHWHCYPEWDLFLRCETTDRIWQWVHFLLVWQKESQWRNSGLGFAIKNTLVKCFMSLPAGVNDRIMSVGIPLKVYHYLMMISVYAPTMTQADKNKESFYLQLKEVVCKKSRQTYCPWWFHCSVWVCFWCLRWWVWKACYWACKFKLAFSALLEYSLLIMFQLRDIHKVTWMYPKFKHWRKLTMSSPEIKTFRILK